MTKSYIPGQTNLLIVETYGKNFNKTKIFRNEIRMLKYYNSQIEIICEYPELKRNIRVFKYVLEKEMSREVAGMSIITIKVTDLK